MKHEIHLGYEVGSGHSVGIPVRHMAVTGQTQESGKTTTLEALISRSDLMAIAFVTKRGEGSFHAGRQIKPYFRERADAEFVRSILETVNREKMKFERAWISKACKGAKSLGDVQRNCQQLELKSRRGLDQDMYMLLGEYLDKVVPLIASLPKSPELSLARGLNVMDLSRYPLELQMLVISSTLQKIYEEAEGVITIIPECWEFVPQGRNSPVKLIVEKLIRKGAGLRNYIWLDSQDMAGVDKLLLRACAVWLVGVQRERNEVQRALGNMYGVKKPKADDVAVLELGQFFVSHGRELKKVYVQPEWMEAQEAIGCVKGELVPYETMMRRIGSSEGSPNSEGEGAGSEVTTGKEQALPIVTSFTERQRKGARIALDGDAGKLPLALGAAADSAMDPAPEAIEVEAEMREQEIQALNRRIAWLEGLMRQAGIPIPKGGPDAEGSTEDHCPAKTTAPSIRVGSVEDKLDSAHEANQISRASMIEEVAAKVLATIRKDPVLIRLSQEVPSIEVHVNRKVLRVDSGTVRGKIALFIHEGWFTANGNENGRRTQKEIYRELVKRGMQASNSGKGFIRPLQQLVEDGFLWLVADDLYQVASGATERIEAA